MTKYLLAALAALVLYGIASANAAPAYTYGCMADGTRVVGRGTNPCWCTVNVAVGQKCPSVRHDPAYHGGRKDLLQPQHVQQSMTTHGGPLPDIGPSPAGSNLRRSERADLSAREKTERQQTTRAPVPLQRQRQVAQATPAANQPSRVFTANVSIETLAAAFKPNVKSDVLNVPADKVVEEVKSLSNFTLTPDDLFDGHLVECQEAGVKGKKRIGVKVKQAQGTKEYSFVAVGSTLDKCLPGQKLYVVKDGNDKWVAIADNSGYLLGIDASTSASGITIDR